MNEQKIATPTIPVEGFLSPEAAPLRLQLLAGGSGLKNAISIPRIQKSGLSLSGYLESIRPGRVQIFGESEIDYLASLDEEFRVRAIEAFCGQPVACIIISKGLQAPDPLLNSADRNGVPVFRSALVSSALIDLVQRFLADRLITHITLHAVLVDLHGLGVLILGESGVGKSELALELVSRGHRLVSDDVVEIRRRGDVLSGGGPDLTRYHMELRGIGIINIKDLFGVAAVRYRKDIELVVRLDPWQDGKAYERLGLDEKTHSILGVGLPFVEMPVAPGRNLSVLIEVAARNHLLKRKGYHPARELVEKLDRTLAGKTPR